MLARLNALVELQAHYRQLRQSFDDHAQQLVRLREHIQELEQTLENKAREERNEFADLKAKHTELRQNYNDLMTALDTLRTAANQQKDAWTEEKTTLEVFAFFCKHLTQHLCIGLTVTKLNVIGFYQSKYHSIHWISSYRLSF